MCAYEKQFSNDRNSRGKDLPSIQMHPVRSVRCNETDGASYGRKRGTTETSILLNWTLL